MSTYGLSMEGYDVISTVFLILEKKKKKKCVLLWGAYCQYTL